MRFMTVLLSLAGLLSATQSFAAPRAFRIASVRQITPNVDRFYGQDGSAFGTLFCNPQTAEVMFVDSRYSDLDGKTFYFGSLANCESARKQARELYGKCVTELVIDVATQGALVRSSQCSN